MTYSSLEAGVSKNIRELQAERSSLPLIKKGFQEATYGALVRKVRETYDSLAGVYDRFYPPLTFDSNQFIRNLHNFLQERGASRILDCACGTGRELIPLAKTGAYNLVIGSDLSAKMLDKARKKAAGLPIKWIQSNWLELPEKLKYDNFDAILCLGNPLAHIPPWSYKDVFSRVFCLLRMGGIFIVNRRNWEAELGEENFGKDRPRVTIYDPVPRISFLNASQQDKKETFAYFTYHNYAMNSRLQLLHLLEVNGDEIKERVFRFRCFYVEEEAVEKALLEVGFTKIEEVNFLNTSNDFDTYAEEVFLSALK